MPNTRRIIRAFLASPGDLQDERRAVRDVVVEFNESWADKLGYQVELVGWEETIAGFGRPQQLINQDLDRCDLFLGMIWKRWGTPPDHDGEFSSGFQEEFERSIARRKETGSPEVSLFFKQIPDEFMVDPGDDLKRVVEFRDSIITGKKILFQNFSTVRDMEILARKCITAYVNRVEAEDTHSEPDEARAKRARSESAEHERTSSESSPLSAEGFEFLEELVVRFSEPEALDSLSASDVARFRLLANSISKPGNEEMELGVHDINILFSARTEGMKLGERETRCLARLGFRHLSSENVPLWCWYSALDSSPFDPALISSLAGVTDNEKVGAITVLGALARELPTDDKDLEREWFLDTWFSEDSSTRVRTAALSYLAKYGISEDFAVAKKEYDRSDHGTSRSALECMIRILLRSDQENAAQELVLDSQFESLDADTLRSVLEGFDTLQTPALQLGLEHRNAQVRLRAMKLLLGRGSLDSDTAERLSGDSDALVRNEAVGALLKLRALTAEEVQRILIPPQKHPTSGLLGLGAAGRSDRQGEELFQQYQMKTLRRLSEAELIKRAEASLVGDDDPYFALVERYFGNHSDELRRDVDDRFNSYFDERVRRVEATFGDSSASKDLVTRTRDLEGFLRKKLTRRGLDVLCRAGKREDLQRIRVNLLDGYAGASKADAKYLRKHGEWTDIPTLSNAKGPTLGETVLTLSGDEEFQGEVARAVASMGRRHSVSDLLSLGMPGVILKKTIELCAESRFAEISQSALLGLFDHESEEVRKAAAVRAVRALSAKRIKSILLEYVGGNKYRYYNVIHWLDLGASMSRDDARRVARAAVS